VSGTEGGGLILREGQVYGCNAGGGIVLIPSGGERPTSNERRVYGMYK